MHDRYCCCAGTGSLYSLTSPLPSSPVCLKRTASPHTDKFAKLSYCWFFTCKQLLYLQLRQGFPFWGNICESQSDWAFRPLAWSMLVPNCVVNHNQVYLYQILLFPLFFIFTGINVFKLFLSRPCFVYPKRK